MDESMGCYLSTLQVQRTKLQINQTWEMQNAINSKNKQEAEKTNWQG